jgi:hypothetical protein
LKIQGLVWVFVHRVSGAYIDAETQTLDSQDALPDLGLETELTDADAEPVEYTVVGPNYPVESTDYSTP